MKDWDIRTRVTTLRVLKPSLAFCSFVLLFLDRLSLRSHVGRPKIPGFTVDICRLIRRFVKWADFSNFFSWTDKGSHENETVEVLKSTCFVYRCYRKVHPVCKCWFRASSHHFPHDYGPKERALEEQAVAFGCRLEHPLEGHGRNVSQYM